MEQEKTREERIAELLDKPAMDAVSAMKGPSLSDMVQTKEESPEAPDVEGEVEETETGGKKVRIPRSRLQTLTKELNELREEVQQSKASNQRIAELETELQRLQHPQEDVPDWWKETFPEAAPEISRKGYEATQRMMREELRQALAQMDADRQAEEQARTERIAQVEQSFDQQMDALEETLGRDLTDNQKSEIMDIVGEYSPQEDGKYLAYLPIEKAYELWQKGQPVAQGKQEIARIAATPSSGATQPSSSAQPPQWGDWRKKYNL